MVCQLHCLLVYLRVFTIQFVSTLSNGGGLNEITANNFLTIAWESVWRKIKLKKLRNSAVNDIYNKMMSDFSIIFQVSIVQFKAKVETPDSG